MKKIIKVLRKPMYVKWMLIKTGILSAWYRWRILNRPFSELSETIGRLNSETSEREISIDERRFISEVRWAVDVICKRTPWESMCMVRALTAANLLKNQGYSTTLYMGVKKEEDGRMSAHAWLRCGNIYVMGGNGSLEYTITTRYEIQAN